MTGLTFERPDGERFPALSLGFRAAREGGLAGAVLNAANEVAVEAFLSGRARFTDIARTVEQVLDRSPGVAEPGLGDIWEADRWAREEAAGLLALRTGTGLRRDQTSAGRAQPSSRAPRR